MKHILPLIALTAGLAALTACTDTRKANDITLDTIESNSTYRLVDSKGYSFNGDTDLCFSAQAQLIVPADIYGKPATTLRDSIVSLAFDTIAAPETAMTDGLRRTAESLGFALADTTVAEGSYDGMLRIDGVVASLTPELISYAVNTAMYIPGAAHGMNSTYYINYDLKADRVVTLSDIVTAEGRADVLRELKDTASELKDYIGETELESLPGRDNFYVNAAGDLVFVYQPYEIASYAQGIIRLTVAPYTIADALTPYGTSLLLK